ncbi:hypothetical protein BTI_4979 [Burkholderia thailandensis MSMB121]|nr:hypothetical protein BTI_4979 [Burkholderia thailandensis MSMB121]AJY40194.1 hypothetical protein BW21_4508 [Burkholderia sp. 2002721687]ALX46683.1 hypothetical protein AQ610_30585 [Burkholderia humptydooensis]ATF33554.1 hypothetical protein CO709_09705 [Burkholderia thailandensis]KVN07782.1 hypothetical protein WT08_17580 [Burkholderia sp. MSMB1552]KWZ49739.1 hypothetical protein WS92_19860 [Burkholderia sp. MSMB1588]
MSVIVWRHASRGVCASARAGDVCACARGCHPVIGRRRVASLPARIGGGCGGFGCEHGPRATQCPAGRCCRQR